WRAEEIVALLRVLPEPGQEFEHVGLIQNLFSQLLAQGDVFHGATKSGGPNGSAPVLRAQVIASESCEVIDAERLGRLDQRWQHVGVPVGRVARTPGVSAEEEPNVLVAPIRMSLVQNDQDAGKEKDARQDGKDDEQEPASLSLQPPDNGHQRE